MVKLILRRTHSNPTCTIGKLTTEDGAIDLYTMEGRIPADREGYIMWLLSPKTYKVHIEPCVINYKDKPVRAYWPVFSKVPWFPKASFFTSTAYIPRKGRIKLGTEKVDDYCIDGCNEACQEVVRWAKSVYDEIGDADFELQIVQNEDEMVFSELTEQQFREGDTLAKEQAEQERLQRELFNIEDNAIG